MPHKLLSGRKTLSSGAGGVVAAGRDGLTVVGFGGACVVKWPMVPQQTNGVLPSCPHCDFLAKSMASLSRYEIATWITLQLFIEMQVAFSPLGVTHEVPNSATDLFC